MAISDISQTLNLGSIFGTRALFNKEKSRYLTGSPETSLFYQRAKRDLLTLIGDSWRPYFEDKKGNRVDNDRAMATLEAPFGNYTMTDLIQQFVNQRKDWKTVLINNVQAEGRAQLQIIDGSSIREVKFSLSLIHI